MPNTAVTCHQYRRSVSFLHSPRGGALNRRECLAGIAVLGLISGCKFSSDIPSLVPSSPSDMTQKAGGGGMSPLHSFTPEDFGAVGDGQTNDTDAFAAMTSAINAQGGGTVILRPRTYIVGKQQPDPMGWYAYAPAPIMEFDGCSKSLTILGNGARLRCADGLRFGTFNPVTGSRTQHTMPWVGDGEVSSPYLGMITVQNCTDKVTIENLELDGNLAGLDIGGQFGDLGWQIQACGLRLLNNSNGERVVGVHSHHHPLDGLYIDGVVDRPTGSVIEKVVSEYNVRQGCSIVGGCNYSFADCQFNHTGKAGFTSAPGAGVDIEAEAKTIRNLSFSGCEFSNNTGPAMGAATGDSSGVTFDNCQFICTTSWAAIPQKPNLQFTDCLFVGTVLRSFPDPDRSRATRFSRCSFSDDPRLSPTGEVFGPTWAIADLQDEDNNVLFDACSFSLTNQLVLPWTAASTYNNCTMSQVSTRQAYPRGIFTGTNEINGNVDLGSSKIIGQLTVNGKVVPSN